MGAAAQAQTNYYQSSRVFKEVGYTYKCDVSISQMVTLYNANNKYTYVAQKYLSTGENVGIDDVFDEFEEETWTKPKCFAIVNKAFTNAEKQRCKGKYLGIELFINSSTGKVMEVNFSFTTFEPFATIPVSVYRQIETELIKSVWFTPTAEGRNLNYISIFWMQEIGETR